MPQGCNRDYVQIVTPGHPFITYHRISYMEVKLPENRFLRIHKSNIIAYDRIRSFKHDSVRVEGVLLPVGRLFKQQVLKRIRAGAGE